MFEITREYLSVFGFQIYWYGVIIACGTFLAAVMAFRRERSFGLKKDTMLDTALICVPVGIIGARLYYVMMMPDAFPDFWSVLDLRSGGLAIYGGLIGGLLSGYCVSKYKKISLVTMFDVAAPCIALAQGIGRWGNFLNQEAYGVRITSPALQFFPVSVYITAEEGWFAATFFYESIWCLLTAFLIFRMKNTKKGACSLMYIVMYAAERCAVEGLRTDSLYIGPMRISQVLSAIILIAATMYIIAAARRKKLILPCSALCAALSFGIIIQSFWLVLACCAALCFINTKSLPFACK